MRGRSRWVAAPPRRPLCPAGTRGGVRAGWAPRRAGLVRLPGIPVPLLFTSLLQETFFFPGSRAVLPGSRSLVFGMRRGLHHMAGGSEAFLQGKIIMCRSRPPPSVLNDLIGTYFSVISCSQ